MLCVFKCKIENFRELHDYDLFHHYQLFDLFFVFFYNGESGIATHTYIWPECHFLDIVKSIGGKTVKSKRTLNMIYLLSLSHK